MKRLPDVDVKEESDKPSVKAICARIKKAHGSLDKSKFAGIMLRGDADFPYQGAKGVVSLIASNSGQHVGVIDLGRLAVMEELFDGKRGVSKSTISPVEEMSGEELGDLESRYMTWIMPDQIDQYSDIKIEGEENIDGEVVFVLEFNKEGSPVRKVFVSKKSGLMIMEKSIREDPVYGKVKTTTKYSEFKLVEGLTVATRVHMSSQFVLSFEMKIKTIEPLVRLPKNAFALPAEDK